MTHPTVKLAAPLLAASGATLATELGAQGAHTAANDEDADAAAESPDADRNPLWIIPIGIACFFAVAAAVLTLG
jgi:hypothetical protein